MSSAGQIVGGIIGAVVGFFTAGPGGAVQGAMYGAGIGIAVGGAIDPPPGPDLKGPRLDDLSQQTSTYGVNIPRVYGTIATRGNVFWLEGGALKEKKKKKSEGGKGGSSSTTTTYHYYATFAIGLADTMGRAPLAGVRRIWLRGKLWYDAGSSDIETVITSNKNAAGFVFYPGSDTQMPDPRMEADIGVGSCPAFRGLAYIVFHDLLLDDFSNTLAAVDAKVELVSTGSYAYQSTIIDLPIGNYWGPIIASDDRVVVFPSGNTGGTSRAVYGFGPAPYFVAPTMPANAFQGRYLNGEFIAVGGYYGPTAIQRSTNGESWSAWAAPVNANYVVDVAYGDGRYVAVEKYRDGFNLFTTSLAFTTSKYAAWSEVNLSHADNWVAVNFNDGRFLAVPLSSGVGSFSDDGGFTWADIAVPSGTWISLEVRDGRFILIGHGATASSADGVAWSVSTLPINGKFSAVAGHEIFVSDGSSSLVVSSDGGATWSFVATPFLVADIVAMGETLFCAPYIATASEYQIVAISRALPSSTALLSDIVAAEIEQSALVSAADIDVSALTATVRGYSISSGGAIRAALEPLRGAWPFDIIQSGYKIKAVPRGGASVATISLEDLDARPYGKENSALIKRQREMDAQLPAKVDIKYLDAEREYDYGEQFAEHLSTDAVGVRTVEMAIVLTSDEAAGMSQALLDMYWLERHETQFTVGPEFGALEPADVVTVASSSGDIELRIVQIDTLPDGRLECSAKDNRSAIYTPNARGAIGSDGGAKLLLDGPSLYHLLDIPLLRSVDNSAGFPVAMSGYTAGWPGGLLMRSTDGGQVWSPLHGFSGSVPMGFAEAAVNAGRFDLPDRANQIRVRLVYGDVYSVSLDAMLAGSNVFAYGAAGRWEIIAVQNAMLGLDGVYVFDGILRGLVGTEWAAALHADGDVVVQLDDTDVAWIAADESSIGQDRLYRGITLGKDISTDASRTFAYTAENLKPLSPVLLNGNRNPSTSDWTLFWTRRGRVDAQWRDLVDVPVGETSEAYDVEIYASAAYAAVKRTISVTSATASYTSAQQVADFGGNQSTLYVRIYQLSTTVGRGRPLQTTITR